MGEDMGGLYSLSLCPCMHRSMRRGRAGCSFKRPHFGRDSCGGTTCLAPSILTGQLWLLVKVAILASLLPTAQSRRYRGRGVAVKPAFVPTGFMETSSWGSTARWAGRKDWAYRHSSLHKPWRSPWTWKPEEVHSEGGGFILEAQGGGGIGVANDTVSVAGVTSNARKAGKPHTAESRAKIAAANKGKMPWNKGRAHSEETKRKIAERTRLAMHKRKVATAESMGLTLDEYMELKNAPPPTRNTTVRMETRLKISQRLKERWQDPVYREERLKNMPVKRGPHSAETRETIRKKVREMWQDPEYRAKMSSRPTSDETKAKLSAIIKNKWKDPVYRAQRMSNITSQSTEHRKRISSSVRARWADPEYRERTIARMKEAAARRQAEMGIAPKAPRPRKPRAPRAARAGAASSAAKQGRASSRKEMPSRPKEKKMTPAEMRKWELKADRLRAQLEEKEQQQRVRVQRKEAREAKKRAAELKQAELRREEEEEARQLEGLDELDALLLRQKLRREKKQKQAEMAREEEKSRRLGPMPGDFDEDECEEYDNDDGDGPVKQDVPEGFELVKIHGRMVIRMT
ncbi:unnamed protein product [Discosporangium mesarthrocarpum]